MNKIAVKMRQVCIRCFFRKVGGVDVVVLQKIFRQPISQNGFTLLELLVAMAVFSMMTVLMLSMTNSLIGNVSRIDENTEIERSVRVFFDLLRRDLHYARSTMTSLQQHELLARRRELWSTLFTDT
jgi:prepilin-type N-terminal cleavage/methylation domain-containing protein